MGSLLDDGTARPISGTRSMADGRGEGAEDSHQIETRRTRQYKNRRRGGGCDEMPGKSCSLLYYPGLGRSPKIWESELIDNRFRINSFSKESILFHNSMTENGKKESILNSQESTQP